MLPIKLALSATTLLFCVQICAQEGINFSGLWQMDASRSESAHQATPIERFTLMIQQSAKELTMESRKSQADNPPTKEILTFKFGASEQSVVGNNGVPIKGKAYWDGTKLVTQTERQINGATVTTKQIFSLNTNGKEMTIDNTLTVQHGYESKAGNNIGKGQDVFIRSKEAIQ